MRRSKYYLRMALRQWASFLTAEHLHFSPEALGVHYVHDTVYGCRICIKDSRDPKPRYFEFRIIENREWPK